MEYCCCFCGKAIDPGSAYFLTVRKEGSEAEQELFCHEPCLERVLHDVKQLYMKCL